MALVHTARHRPAATLSRKRLFELLEVARPGDRASRIVDIVLVVLIIGSVAAIVLESVDDFATRYSPVFDWLQVLSVAIFAVEYLLRIWSAPEHDDERFRSPLLGRLRYGCTPMALVDLVAILPFFLGVFFALDLRFLRILRLLRLLKLARYSPAISILVAITRAEKASIGAALSFLGLVLLFSATGIYYFEHAAQPAAFASIPAAMWWAVATVTTVGYGDVVPITSAGKVFGALVSIVGVSMIAVPAGLMASRLTDELRQRRQGYEAVMDEVLRDGIITADEQRMMETQRRHLGLSETDAATIARHMQWMHGNRGCCPHCGESLIPRSPART